MKLKKYIIILFILTIHLGLFQNGSAQIFSGKDKKVEARSQINLLKEGALIVPFIKQNNKINTLQRMVAVEDQSEKTRKKLQKLLDDELKMQSVFNSALSKYFVSAYSFSKVFFVEDHQLKGFKADSTMFLNPETMEADPSIKFEGEDYFVLKYYKASGVASSPYEVRYFYIADAGGELLPRPFPISPDRKNAYKLRFRDLLNISPDINDLIQILTTKLNENLFRYYRR